MTPPDGTASNMEMCKATLPTYIVGVAKRACPTGTFKALSRKYGACLEQRLLIRQFKLWLFSDIC